MFEKKKSSMSCEDCMHYVICGHKDYMQKALNQLENIEIEKSEFIKIAVKCTEFREIVMMPRGGTSLCKR